VCVCVYVIASVASAVGARRGAWRAGVSKSEERFRPRGQKEEEPRAAAWGSPILIRPLLLGY